VLVSSLAVGSALVLASCSIGGSGRVAKKKTSPTTSTTTAPTTTTAAQAMYQVKRGDTLTSIAKFFGLSTALLLQANKLPNGDRLTEGQVLTIPPLPPPAVAVNPPVAPAGQPVSFVLTQARAGESVTFEVDKPDGSKFLGQAHIASQDGNVGATFQTTGNDPGNYTVIAHGDRGTTAQTTFMLGPG
jgi:LysM repeat protein